jgi:hypothetical protein
MSQKKIGCSCLQVLGLIAILAVGGAYIFKKEWHQFLIGQKLTPLTGAKVIPDDAIMTGFISTNTQDWQQLEKLGIKQIPQIIQQATTEIQQEFTASNLDYQQDIQPWLGNAMIAFVPKNQKLQDSNTLIVLGIKNPLNAYKFLKKIQADGGAKIKSVNYKGIKINTTNNRQDRSLHLALLGNKIVISEGLVAVQQAIDTYKGEPSFFSDRDNQVALKQPLKLKNNLAQLYLTDYNSLINNALAESDSAMSPEQLALLQPVESIVLGIGTEDKQIKIQSFTTVNQKFAELTKLKPITNKIANNFPAETIAFINGQGINQFWSTFIAIAEQDSELKNIVDDLRTSTKSLTNLDLDRDIFGWMNQEFAIGIVSTKQAIIPELNLKLGLALLLQTSDRKIAEKTLNNLSDRVQTQLGLTAQTKQIQKETVTQWSIPYSNFSISHGWLDRNNLVLTVGNNVFESLGNSQSSSLEKNSNFQQFTKKLPAQNISYFYLDLEKVMTAIQQIPGLPLDYNSEAIATLNSIQSIGSASTMTNSNTTQTDVIVVFK